MKLAHVLLITAAPFLLSAAEPMNPVRLNQIGFLPDGAKRAVVPNTSRKPLRWRLVNAQNAKLAEGQTIVAGNDAASGQHVHVVDFSGFARPGTFRLIVGEARSRPFPIAATIYRRLPTDALAYFYHNRAGVPIEARYVGKRWARPAGHTNEVVTCVSGADPHGNVWPGCDYRLNVTGGWYDAGDHGKYVVNGGISVWTLLNLHEQQKRRRPASFAGAPATLLDEVRYQLEFLLRMQAPEGAKARVPVGQKLAKAGLRFSQIDASGMAHHKVADEQWTALPMAPHMDPEKRILFPPSTAATLNLAASAAQCARIWRTLDPSFSGRCLRAAERAYAAARRNPEVYAIAEFTGSGGYGDRELSDEFFWAAAELFATTGKPEYRAALRRSPHVRAPVEEASWPGVAALGTITLATNPSRLAPAERSDIRRRLIAAANTYVGESAREGYRLPYASMRYPWGSTSTILNRAIILALAHDFTRDPRFRDGVIDAMDFILGRNPLDQSFVSGYGARPMRNPHHRFWANQLDPAFPPPPPGALSGGPNNSAMNDEVAKPMRRKCAPQTCWADDARAFALNEVAINWNAPLVWVAAWLDGTSG